MKRMTYKIKSEVNHGTEEDPQIMEMFSDKMIECLEEFFEANFAIAQKEAYNGEVTVEDIEDPETEPTTEEQIAELENAMCEMDAINQEEISALQETTSALEDALCEMEAANEERMAAIEDALCEIDAG